MVTRTWPSTLCPLSRTTGASARTVVTQRRRCSTVDRFPSQAVPMSSNRVPGERSTSTLPRGGIGDHVDQPTAGQIAQVEHSGAEHDVDPLRPGRRVRPATHLAQGDLQRWRRTTRGHDGARGVRKIGEPWDQLGAGPRGQHPGEPFLVLGPADPTLPDRRVQDRRGAIAVDVGDAHLELMHGVML